MFSKKIKKQFFCLIYGSLFLFFLASQAWALTVRINPAKIRSVIPPGSSKSGQITLTNTSDKEAKVVVYLEDWKYVAPMDGTKDFAAAGTFEHSACSWINFSPNEINIPPFATQDVSYSISVPEGAEGTHFAIMFFESDLGGVVTEKGETAMAKIRAGALFFVDPQGTIQRKTVINDTAVTNETGGIKINAKLKNSGNSDIIASGTFDIIDDEGNVYGRGKFKDIYTFPGSIAEISGSCPENLKEGKYDIIITLRVESGDTIIMEPQITIGPDGNVLKVANQS